MTARKFFLRLIAIYAIAFVLVYLLPQPMYHRRAFDKAFSTWLHDRTPQNEEALRAEQLKNERIKLLGSGVIALAFVTIGSAIYFTIRFAHQKLVRHRSEIGIPDSR
jgi:hypothetical protein